jgi:hypothetical protein
MIAVAAILQAGVAFMALIFALEDPACVNLGTSLFGPEFSKSFNAPTEKEIRQQEEQKERNKKLDEAYPFRDSGLDPANLRKGAQMDFSSINKAVEIVPNDADMELWRYSMLIAAGKEAEARKSLARAQQIYREESDPQMAGLDPRTRRANNAAYKLNNAWERLDPNSDVAKRLRDDICVQVRTLRSVPPTPGWETWSNTEYAQKHNC